MSLCKGEGPRYPILKTFCDFLTKKYDFQLIVFSFPAPQVPSPPTKVSQNLKYFSGDPTRPSSAPACFSSQPLYKIHLSTVLYVRVNQVVRRVTHVEYQSLQIQADAA